ncbi:kinase-like domain-containing protein [Phlyctochytrium arcticum]|nr:kinase-like domain-containing protein [Phlyctochytrium arcticum]
MGDGPVTSSHHSTPGRNSPVPSLAPLRTGNGPSRPANGGGQRIGPYAVGKTLGVGSTGRVKLGVHVESGQRVAIKIIPKDSLANGGNGNTQASAAPPSVTANPAGGASPPSLANKKLEREITIMKLIQHPHVLQLYDVYETDKELFLILEHVEGGELFDYLVKKGRLSEPEALGFFQQIMSGIDFCHRYLICHRDLKPENLLLDRDLNVKIADFGMASLQVTGKMLETSCGSPHYASPEIIKGIRYDGPTADIWSCGVILYALLTGNLPFDDENIRRLLSKVKSGMYFIPDHISASAKDLIKRMLVVDPSKRIQMQDIFQHPWFLSIPLKSVGDQNTSMPDPAKMTKPVNDLNDLDHEVLTSLSLLGWGDADALIEALRIPEPNMEKVFYNLLLQRKWDFFEHYDIRELSSWDVEGGPRRRTNSYASLNTPTGNSRFDLFRSEMSLANTDGTMRRSTDELRKSVDDLRRSREELRKSADIMPSSSGSQEDIRARSRGSDTPSPSTEETKSGRDSKDRPKKIFTGANKFIDTSVRVNSPLSASTHFGNEHSVPSPTSAVAPGDHSRSASLNRPGSAATDGKTKLTISIPLNDEGSGGEGGRPNSPSLEKSGGLGTPKFHRKKHLAIPPTPLITSTPKRSWFASLFNFRPEVYFLQSGKSLEDTQNAMAELLAGLDIKFQARKEGGFKCKFEGSLLGAPLSPGIMSSASPTSPSSLSESSPTSTKSVKFRVEMGNNEGDTPTSVKVQFVQQQGAYSSFQMIVDRIKTTWEMKEGAQAD